MNLIQSETEVERSHAQNQQIIKSGSLLTYSHCGDHNIDIKKEKGIGG